LNKVVHLGSIPLLLILVVYSTLAPASASSSLSIFPPDSEPYGLTYDEHAQNFWKWMLSIPANESPMDDTKGDKCTVGQSNSNSSIFYLSAGEGKMERTCTIPAGKGLLLPVMQVEISDKEIPGASIEDLTNAAKKDQDSVNSLYLKIDNEEYTYNDLLKYRTQPTAPFQVIFPDNGIFGVVEGGPSQVVADGWYIISEPLTPGNHTVHFRSSLSCPDVGCIEPAFAQDVKYNIIAK
jgi:hypothetical protein